MIVTNMTAKNEKNFSFNVAGVHGVEETYGYNQKKIESKIEKRRNDIANLKKMSFLSKMLNVVSSYMKNSLNVYARINNLKQDIAIGNALLNNNPEERATAMKTALSKKSSFMDRREKITLIETQYASLESLNKLITDDPNRKKISDSDFRDAYNAEKQSCTSIIETAITGGSPSSANSSNAVQKLRDRKNKTTRNTI